MRSAGSKEGKKKIRNTPHSEHDTPNLVHVPVLLREAIDYLDPKSGGVYVDGTIGAGGHAAEILKRSTPDGKLIGMDQDAEAVARCMVNLAAYSSRVIISQANFREIPAVLSGLGYGQVDGVLLDLGISWFHLKTSERGFSFMLDGPLDMRMDRRLPHSAADLVNTLSHDELVKVLREYGEEHKAGAIARAIERERTRGAITSTVQLAKIVSSVFPPYPLRRIHPATLTFQALRIAVNDEMGALQEGLDRIIPLVKPGGRIAVITFHSLEDRIVKQTFVKQAKGCDCPPKMPVCACGKKPVLKVITHRAIKPGEQEVEQNPAARSAKLRVAEKL